MQFHRETLPNGLEIVAEINPAAHSVAFGFFVSAGSRDESAEVHGVSHFLEHMAFKGTAALTGDDVNRLFDELGADYNAATSEESTVFYAAVLPEYFPQAFETQSAILQPALRDLDFDTEKQVILEEIGMYDDQPQVVAYDCAMQTHFRSHPLGTTILGTAESVGKLTSAQMRAYHAERYRAGNIVLAVAGNINWDQVRWLAEQNCGGWPAGRPPRRTSAAVIQPSCRMVVREHLQLQQVLQLAPAPNTHDPLRFAAEVLSIIVGDEQNSRLYWELADPGLVESVDMSYNDFHDAGTWMWFLSGPAEELSSHMQQMHQVLDAVNCAGVTAEELAQAKRKVASRVVLRGERPMGRLSSLGSNWMARREYRTIRDDLEIIEALSRDDLRTLLDRFPLTPQTTVGVGPLASLSGG